MQGLVGRASPVQLSEFLTLAYNEKPQIHARSKDMGGLNWKIQTQLKTWATLSQYPE